MPKSHPCPKCSTTVPEGSRFCQNCGSTVAPAGAPARSQTGVQWKVLVGGALAVVVVASAAMAAIGQSRPAAAPTVTAASKITTIPGAGPIPDWLVNTDPAIIELYAWAAQNYEVLQYIPCYCGCGSVGHKGNADCYFRWDKNGKIIGYDAHALG